MHGSRASSGNALDVFARSGIHPDRVVRFDEERRLNGRSRFERYGLGAALGGIAAHARRSVGDAVVNLDGKFRRKNLLFEHERNQLELRDEPASRVAELVAAQREAVFRIRRVLEPVLAAVLVAEACRAFLHIRFLNGVTALEGAFERGAGAQVADAGIQNSSAAAQLHMLGFEHFAGIAGQKERCAGSDIGKVKERH